MKNSMDNVASGQTKYTRFMLFILAIVLLVASIVGYIASRKMNVGLSATTTNYTLSPTNFPIPTPSLIPYPVRGSLSIKEIGNTPHIVGTPITFAIIATSGKDTVAGYDVVISYDMSAFENQLIQNKLNSFKIYTFKRAKHISVSATKDLSVTEAVRMSNVSILSLSFLPKQKGTYVFSLKPVGNESSKFVSEAAAVTYPETSDISLEIK